MINFETTYFRKLYFKEEQIKQLSKSALHDLKIAEGSDISDVIFRFSYDALLKLGIVLIAKGGYKVRSTAGHHIKILEKMNEILKNEDVIIFGNKMRQQRNFNLYSGGFSVTEKDSREYLDFVKSIFKKANVK